MLDDRIFSVLDLEPGLDVLWGYVIFCVIS